MTKPVIKPSWAASDPKLYRRFRTLQLRVDRMIKKHTPKATLIRMAADKRGSAALEFALVVPVLLLFMGGVVDFGRAFYLRTELDQALRSGMQYALKAPTDLSGIQSVVGQSTSLPITVSRPVASCACYDGSAIACTATCAGGGPMRSYVTLGASYAYAPVLPGTMGGLLPGSPLTAALVVRTQ